jgi:hypothetical protein
VWRYFSLINSQKEQLSFMTKIGNGPINPAYKVQRQPGQGGQGINFDARWEVSEAPLNTLVGIKAVARKAISGSVAEIKVFQLLNGRVTVVDHLKAPFQNGTVSTAWRTKPARAGNFQEGVYHFEVSVAGHSDQTVKPLLLRNAAVKLNQDGFEAAKPKPKVVL